MKLVLRSLILIAMSGCGSRWSQAATVPYNSNQALSPLEQIHFQQSARTPISSSSSKAVKQAAAQPADDTPEPETRPVSTSPIKAPAQPAPSQTAPAQGGKPLQIRLYRSYGSDSTVHVRGRVMKPETSKPVNADDSSLTNLIRNLENLSVDEVPGVKVDVTIQGHSVRLVSDHEGMLLVSSQLFGKLEPGIEKLQARIVPGQGYWAPDAEISLVIQPASDKTLGIVSDIDDTIKVSEVTNKLVAAKRLLFGNEKTAEMIPGTSTLYQILEQHDGKADGDVHYLSGSPLNLADAIYSFLDEHGFPFGAVDLKKWGFDKGDDNPIQQQDYKQNKLRQLLNTYPDRVYLFFGDSGEKDPEIYKQIASEFPGRVKGIFINHVSKDSASDPRFQGVNLTKNAAEAASILQKAGLLTEADVAKVRQSL